VWKLKKRDREKERLKGEKKIEKGEMTKTIFFSLFASHFKLVISAKRVKVKRDRG
jgi:hypothetical protein